MKRWKGYFTCWQPAEKTSSTDNNTEDIISTCQHTSERMTSGECNHIRRGINKTMSLFEWRSTWAGVTLYFPHQFSFVLKHICSHLLAVIWSVFRFRWCVQSPHSSTKKKNTVKEQMQLIHIQIHWLPHRSFTASLFLRNESKRNNFVI